ncbi:hypothetical protein LX32DRAFT_652082 [Colletotrichum zoysiae]|uniref:Uncharacterized protein n=1 Tax=Colletotrichum zoysiae TaxID=1216348 RepID=A0AAD9HJ62_9PEZI|nr:hypothetical protein LX32DRAFT_652082 [Colletotrichum zoysiae]
MDKMNKLDDWRVTRHRIRTFSGFATIALANAVLARITHAANYLIIPYPQPVVILLELLPAALTKIFLPFIYGYVPQNSWANGQCYMAIGVDFVHGNERTIFLLVLKPT